MRKLSFITRLFGLFFIGIALSCSLQAEEAAKADAVAVAPAPTPEMIRQGQDLFLGAKRFGAGGPACNACHNVVNAAVVGGGTLAVDLTEAFDRWGADGLLGTLPRKGAPSPFTVMQAAYEGRDITAEESAALVAFLQSAHAQRATQKSNDLGTKMLLAGVGGVALLLLLFSLVGQGRKRRSVNQDIYDRQVISH